MKRLIALTSHLLVFVLGFAAGIYLLPILTAPDAPTASELSAATQAPRFTGTFVRELKDSDALHWGQGTVTIGQTQIALKGELSPGPDYRLYLSPEFVETEADFKRLKSRMVQVGEVKTFKNFLLPLPPGIDPAQYRAVIIWCEAFGEFITAAPYQAVRP